MLVCTSFFEPEKGAAPHRVTAMAATLQADVTVITPLANYPTGKFFSGQFTKLLRTEKSQGVRIKRYWMMPTNSNSAILRMVCMVVTSLAAYLTTLKHLLFNPGYDKIIIQTPPLTSAFAYQLAALPFKKHCVLNVSDIWPSTAVDLGAMKKNSASWKAFRFMELFLYERANSLIAQSIETRDYLESHSDKPKLLFRNLTPNLSNPTADKKGKVKIIYAGLLGLAQDVATICKGVDWDRLNAELHVYGDGNQKETIANLCIPGVHCYSPIPKSEIQELMGQFDFSLVPLKSCIFGAFPSKITAAVASAVPVLFVGQGEGASTVESLSIGKAFDFQKLSELEKYLEHYTNNREEECEAFQAHIIHAQNHVFNVEANNNSLNQFVLNP